MGNGLMSASAMDATFGTLRSLSEERELSSIVNNVSRGMDILDLTPSSLTNAGALPMGGFRSDSPTGEARCACSTRAP